MKMVSCLFALGRFGKPALPKVRTVADLADGEIFCTDIGEWLQVLPRAAGEVTLCDRESAPGNRYNKGWIGTESAYDYTGSNRPARLLHAPTLSSHGKEAFHVSNPSDRFVIKLIFSDGDLRAMVWSGNTYRVFMLDDLRVIPE